MLAALSEAWHALPYPGALTEQPFRIITIGARMREFAQAYSLTVEQKDPPAWAKKAVAHVQALSALERMA